MKYNFGLIKNKKVKFITTIDGNKRSFCGILLRVRNNKDSLEFIFENNKLVIKEECFKFLLFRKIDGIPTFIFEENNKLISGWVSFCMFDTYGFPCELTEEILGEKGFKVDVEGFLYLKELQKEQSKGTFVQSSAF